MEEIIHQTEPLSFRADQVVAATRTLFLRYGYRRTSVDDIAREAGVAKATLYAYFPSKQDMFRAMILRYRAETAARCDAAETLDGPPAERIHALLCAHFCTALEWFGDATHLHELKLVVHEQAIDLSEDGFPTIGNRLRSLLTEATERGELTEPPTGLSFDQVARTLTHAARGAKHDGRSKGPDDLRRDLDVAVRLVMTGLLPRP